MKIEFTFSFLLNETGDLSGSGVRYLVGGKNDRTQGGGKELSH